MKNHIHYFILILLVLCFNSTKAQNKLDKHKFEEAIDYLKSQSFQDGVEELIIVKNGEILFAGDSINKKHNIYSCAKTFTSMVLGLLIEDKKASLQDYAWKYEPNLSTFYPQTQLKHFATMTSGYSATGRSRWKDENSDWSLTPYLPEKPHFESGTHFEYWDEAQMMYGRVLTNILGRTMKEYLDDKLMNHLDFEDWEWVTEGKTQNGVAINNGCSGIKINANQMAKIGLLFLNKGNWNGKQLISKKWCAESMKMQVDTQIPVFSGERATVKGSGSYGFNWWVNSKNGLSNMPDSPLNTAYMSGLNHNICCIVPEWNVVIVRLGDDKNPITPKHIVWNEFLKKLGEAGLNKK
jgi:CubicO group peptidase (beta-lactamase class C family)